MAKISAVTVKPDGDNTLVPAKILTPDRVETRIGTLEFADGLPTEATAQLLYARRTR